MNAIHNRDNTIDITGLTLHQAQTLYGGIRGSSLFSGNEHLAFGLAVYPPARALEPHRRADGRFTAKKWVARFAYSKDFGFTTEAREVVTECSGGGKKRPTEFVPRSGWILPTHLQGYDTNRKACRRFKVSKIHGTINWSREYTD